MKTDTQPAAMGTVISGTLRPQDLIPAFTDELMVRDPHLETLAGSDWTIPTGVLGNDDHEWWASDDCMALIERLHISLNEVAPQGTVFGAHDGDGADFGFWPVDPETGEITEEKVEQRPARVFVFKTPTDGDAEDVKDLLATGLELAEQERPTAGLVILVNREGSYSQYVAASSAEHALVRAELHALLTEMALETLEDRAEDD